MLFTYLIINLIVVVTSNPFHKYPYVFLLDLGNEEIQNTISEQIRVSIPGGSFALKYPAVPGTDIISHVRVSGIDFGTDLKANIVDGGPGYNYVVLVFMGNPGVTYDAVITIDIAESKETAEDDENDSAEDLEDKFDSSVAKVYSEKTSKDAMIASSDVYKYANKVVGANYKDYEQNEDSDNDTIEENEDDNNANENTDSDDQQSVEQSLENDSFEDKNDLNNLIRSKYVSYESFKPRLYGGVRIYPQAGLYVDDTDSRPVYDPENHENDEQVYERSDANFRDSNNNLKLDYTSAME